MTPTAANHSNRGTTRQWLLALLHCAILAATFSFGVRSASAQQVHDDKNPEAKWETLDNCKLVTNEAMDGDSFHLLHDGREYLIRLYFVDAPEEDATLRDRIQDQAAYFGINVGDVTRAGHSG